MNSHTLLQPQKKQQTFEVTIEPTLLSTLQLSVDETMELLRVSGAGVVLLQHEKLRMVVASDEVLSKIEPSQFYTQQTIKQNRINEIMMPFGCRQGDLYEDKFSQQIYYYHGIPIRNQDEHCIGCLFVINNKHCSLSAVERKTFSLLHRALQLTILMHAQQQIATRSLDNDIEPIYTKTDIITLVNTIDDMVFVKNTRFEILFANTQFLQFYPEEKRDKIIGYTTFEEYLPEEVDAFTQDDRDAFAKGHIEVVETISFPNGSIRTLITNKTRINLAGELVIFCVAKDITKQQLLHKQLEQTQYDIEFLSKMSIQQLSKPIDKIQRLANYIYEDFANSVDNLALDQLKQIQENSTAITRFIDTLTQLSQIQRRHELLQTFSFPQLINEILKLIELPEKSHLICSELIVKLPRSSCQMVLMALVNNTLHHGQQKDHQIIISVEYERYGTTIHYRDSGIGFSEESIKHFKRLWSDANVPNHYLAAQPGLHACKRILDLYDGTMEIVPFASSHKISIFWPNQ